METSFWDLTWGDAVLVQTGSFLPGSAFDINEDINYNEMLVASGTPEAFIELLIDAVVESYCVNTPGNCEIRELTQANTSFIFDALGHMLPDGDDRTIL